jgi:hypothetical protein
MRIMLLNNKTVVYNGLLTRYRTFSINVFASKARIYLHAHISRQTNLKIIVANWLRSAM